MTDIRRKNKFKLILDIFANVLGMALLFMVIWFLFYRYDLAAGFLYKKGTAVLIFIYAAQFFLFAGLYGGHNIEYLRTTEIIYSQCLSMVLVNFITWLQICLIDRRIVAVKPMLLLCGAYDGFGSGIFQDRSRFYTAARCRRCFWKSSSIISINLR